MRSGYVVGGDAAVAGMSRCAGRSRILVIDTGEAVGVVAHAEALAIADVEIHLAEVHVVIQAAAILRDVLLKLRESELRRRIGRRRHGKNDADGLIVALTV